MSTSAPRVRWRDLPKTLLGFIDNRAQASLVVAERYGGVVRLPMPTRRILLVTSPTAIRHVLLDNYRNYKKSFDDDLLSEFVGRGLITSDGDAWLAARRTVQPMFSANATDAFVDTMARRAAESFGAWQGEQDLAQGAFALTLQVIADRLFGEEVGQHANDVARIIDVCQLHTVKRSLRMLDLDRYFRTPGRRRFERTVADLDRIMYQLIDRARSGEDWIGMLSAARDPDTGAGFSKQQVRDQMVTLFFAGFETTTVGLTWTLHLLANHHEWQTAIADEVFAVCGSANPSAADLPSLKITRQVIDESMRLYPPVPAFGREAVANDVVDGAAIEPGDTLAFCPYATHRRSDLWATPERFDPTRFAGEPPDRFRYLPFGVGPRACVGARLAIAELVVLVAAAIKRLRLESLAPYAPPAAATISYQPAVPLRVRVHART